MIHYNVDDATAILMNAGLNVSVVEVDSDADKGIVVDQDHRGESVSVGTTITIWISTGPAPETPDEPPVDTEPTDPTPDDGGEG